MTSDRTSHIPRSAADEAVRPGQSAIAAASPRNGVLGAQTVLDLWQAGGEDQQPMYLIDAAGTLIYANAAYQRIAPFLDGIADIAIEDIAASIEALGRPLRQDAIARIGERCECYVSERMVVRDSAGRPFAIMGRLIPAGDLKRMEAALALAEDRLDDVARLMSDWIWEVDPTLTLRFVSSRVFEQLGHHPQELIGRSLAEFVEPAGRLERLLAPGGSPPVRQATVEMRSRQGDRRTVRINAVAVFDPETGAFRGYRGTAQDVTEREAQYAALLKALDDAEAANRAKTEFLANMSHELRTPLNAIMGFAEMMKLELMGPIGHAKYREYSRDILASSGHLLNLINDILDIAKIEAGRLDLDERDIAPSELLEMVQRLVAESAERAGVALRLADASGLPRLRADERRLKQIMLNLLSNAIKFTPAGGKVTLAARRTEDGGLEFVVSDTGIGIAPDEIATAMAPFSQLDAGLARKFEGTGLGLPLSKALTELHGGSFLLESQVGEGTTVRVRLPASRVIAD